MESGLAAVPAITPQQPSVFSLSEAGYFYGGTGVVPGVTPGTLAYFQVRVWRNAVSFETATERGISTVFTQQTGSWMSNATPPFIVGGQFTVTNGASNAKAFYRLKNTGGRRVPGGFSGRLD